MTAERFRLACVQLNSGNDMAANLAAAADLVRRAREAGAELIATPENTAMMEPDGRLAIEKARPEADHPALAAFSEFAVETGAWLLLGSIAVRAAGEARAANRSYLITPSGAVAARYDKIHMFDVNLPSGDIHRESKSFRPGRAARLADTPWGRLGMTVCYDLRFPGLYRSLAQAGAGLLSVPAAFTRVTGRAHWHVLLRARAIENGCFVFAPAQTGTHPGPRHTFGHSLVVDPWGEVLADGGEEPGFVVADIDMARVDEARDRIPSLAHDRPFAAPAAIAPEAAD